ncbi:innexin unc-9-like isoform X1 [Haliotis cracherodii]|uniref:innexin unc-9-like isoform X1 n=2 Tax=Haliotis cracherodii TaxID=6455 RepID=UPI0039E7CF3D
MVLDNIINKFSQLRLANVIRDDDVVDQLHHYVMVVTLTTLAIGIGTKQFVGKPIHCWLPAQYKEDDQQDYVNSLCWISDLYNVPFIHELPIADEDRFSSDKAINYYRWAMLILILQAVMFELPHFFWKSLKGHSGLNIKKIISMCMECQLSSKAARVKKLGQVAMFIDRWLRTYRRFTTPILNCCQFGKRSGRYLVLLYMFTKFLYLVNVVAQFQILTIFLGFNYWTYGVEVGGYLAEDPLWKDFQHFPRIGMCDYDIRQLQNIHRYTVQCVLSINLFLEKIFAGQWFVMVILSVVTLLSFLSWLVEEVFTSRRERFLHKYIYLIDEERKKDGGSLDTKLFKKFVRGYLRQDGVFLIRIVVNNTNDILAYDLLNQLWKLFENKHKFSSAEAEPLINGVTLGEKTEGETATWLLPNEVSRNKVPKKRKFARTASRSLSRES